LIKLLLSFPKKNGYEGETKLKITILTIILILIILLIGILLGFNLKNCDIKEDTGIIKAVIEEVGEIVKPPLIIPNNEDELINNCDIPNASISKKMNCVEDYVNTFYKYNSTDDNMVLSFEELKSQGGDCRNWARLYERIGKAYDYEVKIESLFVKEIEIEMHGVIKKGNLHHTVTIISNEEGFCLASNNLIKCGEYPKKWKRKP